MHHGAFGIVPFMHVGRLVHNELVCRQRAFARVHFQVDSLFGRRAS